jgi:hypothetical protein
MPGLVESSIQFSKFLNEKLPLNAQKKFCVGFSDDGRSCFLRRVGRQMKDLAQQERSNVMPSD